MRALVLAAGRGERMRPLTDRCPKPLLPVLGTSIVGRTLRSLAGAGVDAAAVNLFHLGDEIREALGDAVDGMPLVYRPETELLGTLGPLGGLGEFFDGTDPILLVNGDSLCDWPVEAMIRAHRSGGAQATLLLSAAADTGSFGGGVCVDERGRILSFRGGGSSACARSGVFAGFHVIDPDLLRGVAHEPADIVRDLYEPALARGVAIRGVFTGRRWHDLGTPRRYLDGVLDEARATLRSDDRGSDEGWRHPTAEVRAATTRASVLEAGAVVEEGAVVERSLLLPGVVVGARARVADSILGPGVTVPEAEAVAGVVLTRGDGGTESVSI